MSRTALLTQREARAQQDLDAKRMRAAKAETALKTAQRKARDAQRETVGILAEEAGLFLWNTATLAHLFALLARLTGTPNPVAVLETLLAQREEVEACGAPGASAPPPGSLPPSLKTRNGEMAYAGGGTSETPPGNR